ncbi:MAG: hypothetical protein SGJ09_12540, partial [Phycisphaerae bacterium]|nr:hypothetical protein [Phycisphaerae bacterium]
LNSCPPSCTTYASAYKETKPATPVLEIDAANASEIAKSAATGKYERLGLIIGSISGPHPTHLPWGKVWQGLLGRIAET